LLAAQVVVKSSQNAESIAREVARILNEYGLAVPDSSAPTGFSFRKIVSFTTDTTAVMPNMVGLLNLLWIPCAGHVFNLVIKDALQVRQFAPSSHILGRVRPQVALPQCHQLHCQFYHSPRHIQTNVP
jgi:hypothetical protein